MKYARGERCRAPLAPHGVRLSFDSLSRVRRLVIKVGSSLLTEEGRGLNMDFLAKLAAEISSLRRDGREVVLVTSGAVAAGVAALALAVKPREIRAKQAVAAVGQSRLMHAYETIFRPLAINVAQILLTNDDLANRRRFLNARNTLFALLELGVLPIINENDTVAVEEIKVGDNDNLSALIAPLVEADLLVILSDIGGLFEEDPRKNPGARRIGEVHRIDAAIERLAGGAGTVLGTGGMITKIQAARKATASGIGTVVADGRTPDVLRRLLSGEDIGTRFHPVAGRLTQRKHWIAFNLKPAGKLWLDDGACRAVVGEGKSLLPSGVRGVEGSFGRGEAVSIYDTMGTEIARGLTEYSADEIRKIQGKRSSEIEAVLGYKYSDEVVHRDDLVILERSQS